MINPLSLQGSYRISVPFYTLVEEKSWRQAHLMYLYFSYSLLIFPINTSIIIPSQLAIHSLPSGLLLDIQVRRCTIVRDSGYDTNCEFPLHEEDVQKRKKDLPHLFGAGQ